MSDAPWKVQQYCYFWVASRVVSASEITELLGVVPDRVRHTGTPAPIAAPVGKTSLPPQRPMIESQTADERTSGAADPARGGGAMLGGNLAHFRVMLVARSRGKVAAVARVTTGETPVPHETQRSLVWTLK